MASESLAAYDWAQPGQDADASPMVHGSECPPPRCADASRRRAQGREGHRDWEERVSLY